MVCCQSWQCIPQKLLLSLASFPYLCGPVFNSLEKRPKPGSTCPPAVLRGTEIKNSPLSRRLTVQRRIWAIYLQNDEHCFSNIKYIGYFLAVVRKGLFWFTVWGQSTELGRQECKTAGHIAPKVWKQTGMQVVSVFAFLLFVCHPEYRLPVHGIVSPAFRVGLPSSV